MNFTTRLHDENLRTRWHQSSEHLAALVADDEKLLSWELGRGMDKACIPLCNAMNLVPGIATCSSCEGHGNDEFYIMFTCNSTPSLHFLCDVFSTCLSGTLDDENRRFEFGDWNVEVCNWHSIQLRLFENVEFAFCSKSLGHEQNGEFRIEVAKEMARVIAAKAKGYCDEWDAYLDRITPGCN